ncbi:hypothetical protein KFE25_007835 [Diacronema lutheri]|uniref:Isochorismatase-like domain-containing protein n=1 Tax=Diacronema lutheri TaxID=2081491 RepID=A0A8J5XVE2_DIALT|nr:hypothetical protein KFE25_007835 [Diacronema lutheri]
MSAYRAPLANVPSAEPYVWPYDGAVERNSVALIIIDMQVDFCGRGGYVDTMGYDIALTRAPIEPLSRVLAAAREAGVRVIHTREGHRPSLSDLPANKRFRSAKIGAEIGQPGPCGRVLTRGEPGWEIIPELAPLQSEDVIDKPGKGCFMATDLDHILRTAGIRHILLGGITTDVCVHTTLRDANDLGFECLLLADGTAATDVSNHMAALHMVKMQGSVFGAVATCDAAALALAALGPKPAPPPPMPTEQPRSSADSAAAHARVSMPGAMPTPFSAPVGKLALVMIDFQRDFMEEKGFAASLGNDVSRLLPAVEPARRLLAAFRQHGLTIVHTLECHAPDLSDLHESKRQRCSRIAQVDCPARGRILIRGEPGNAIVPALTPQPGELIVHKPGKGSFYATGLHERLQALGITHLVFAGVTTEVCVQTSMREANDRGYECVLVTDATESYFPQFKRATIEMIVAQNGIVGWTADTAEVVAALDVLPRAMPIAAGDGRRGAAAL